MTCKNVSCCNPRKQSRPQLDFLEVYDRLLVVVLIMTDALLKLIDVLPKLIDVLLGLKLMEFIAWGCSLAKMQMGMDGNTIAWMKKLAAGAVAAPSGDLEIDPDDL